MAIATVPIPPTNVPVDVNRQSLNADANSIYAGNGLQDVPRGTSPFFVGDSWNFVFNQNPTWSSFWSQLYAWMTSLTTGVDPFSCGSEGPHSVEEWVCLLWNTAVFYRPDGSIDATGIFDNARGNGWSFSVPNQINAYVASAICGSFYSDGSLGVNAVQNPTRKNAVDLSVAGQIDVYVTGLICASVYADGTIGTNGIQHPALGNAVDLSVSGGVDFFVNSAIMGSFSTTTGIADNMTTLWVAYKFGGVTYSLIQVPLREVLIEGNLYVFLGFGPL